MNSQNSVQTQNINNSVQYFVNLLGELGVDFNKIGVEKSTDLVEKTATLWVKFIENCINKVATEDVKQGWIEFKNSNFNPKINLKYPQLEIALKVYSQKFIENLI